MASNLSAIELLKLGNVEREKPFLNAYWPQFLGVAFGTGVSAYHNFQTRRPVFSGIQKYAVGIGLFTLAFSYVQKKRDEYFAEKDAVLRHYIELHPEDFTESAKQKIGDILEPWIPVR